MRRSIFIVEEDEDDLFFLEHGMSAIGCDDVYYTENTATLQSLLEALPVESFPSVILIDCFNRMERIDNFMKFIRSVPMYDEIKVAVLLTVIAPKQVDFFNQPDVAKVFVKPNRIDEFITLAKDLKAFSDTAETK